MMKARPKTNPLIAAYGPGPDDAKCKTCTFHFFREFSKNYPKCERRGVSGSASTDHSSRYDACGKYVAKLTGKVRVRFACSACGVLSPPVERDELLPEQMIVRGFRKDENEPGAWIGKMDECSDCFKRAMKRQKSFFK